MIHTMTPGLRNFALTTHVVSSIGLLGAISAFLALAITGLTSQDAQTVRFAYPAMESIARFVIVPFAFASLLTGLIQSLGTPWGLFQHYWVLVKLLLTVFATLILLIKMQLIGDAARFAEETILPAASLHVAGLQLVVHAVGGLLTLLVPTVLSIYKPRGLTPYGRRKQLKQRAPSQPPYVPLQRPFSNSNADMGGASIIITLRRAHVLCFIAIVVASHMIVLHLTSGGLGHH